MNERPLKDEEVILLKFLIELIPNKQKDYVVPETAVELDDGGMGSIRFGTNTNRKFGKDLAQVKYTDKDHVLVLITLIADNNDDLFELEFWKVDFSELKEYPTPAKVEVST